MAPRDSETDRLIELHQKVDAGFARLDTDVRELRTEMKSLRIELKGEIDSSRVELKGEIGSLKRTLMTTAVAIAAALIGSNAF
ncbi:MAG TPA: hypothetical protein VFU16_09565 [Solirubrobacterales bacterium]|nr:hypothetical protein [Solirubrobacterales bacterium]